MTPRDLLHESVDPALEMLAALGVRSDNRARVLVMAIAGQESEWKARRQIGIGQYYPQTVGARGYWQFESTWGGPVAINEVMQKAPSVLAALCAELDIPVDERALYEAVAWNDVLAAALARLLLWVDPAALPAVGAVEEGWDYYLRNWKPGAPHHETWPARYATAMELIL